MGGNGESLALGRLWSGPLKLLLPALPRYGVLIGLFSLTRDDDMYIHTSRQSRVPTSAAAGWRPAGAPRAAGRLRGHPAAGPGQRLQPSGEMTQRSADIDPPDCHSYLVQYAANAAWSSLFVKLNHCVFSCSLKTVLCVGSDIGQLTR